MTSGMSIASGNYDKGYVVIASLNLFQAKQSKSKKSYPSALDSFFSLRVQEL